MWASTHNNTLKDKMSAIVDNLYLCQKKIGSGYLSAFPSKEFDRFEAIKPVWAPYYTIHKILAGLLDQYTFGENTRALKMVTWMVDYFYNCVQNVISQYSVERHYVSLNEETGGMNDVLYKLYVITGDTKHLLLAHLFDKPCFLGLLAVQEMGIFFLNIVNSSHSYATGGTSVSEFWSDPKRLASTLQTENEESCTTYNMLKVSRHQFKWTKEIAYADYYERALTNGVLGIQRGTEPGVMIYMLPLGRGDSKARSYHGWGKPFESFLCCYGTGIESFSKLADSIYFEEGGEVPGLYIIQYISSLLDWKSGQIVLNQTVDQVNSWDTYLRVTLTFSSKEGTGKSSTLNLRTPTWTASNGAKAALNGQSLSVPAPDDRPEYASIQAILYGPYLLAAHTSGNWDIETGSANSIADWITSIPSSYNNFLVSFSQEYGNSKFAIAVTNQSIALDVFPETGTDAFAHATFRLILNDLSTKLSTVNDAIGKSVILELFDLPGKVLVQQGKDKNLGIADLSSSKDSSVFRLVPGLDGKNTTVSLESESFKGCFVYSEKIVASAGLKLICSPESSDAVFNQAASFVKSNGISIILSALWLKEQQGAFF